MAANKLAAVEVTLAVCWNVIASSFGVGLTKETRILRYFVPTTSDWINSYVITHSIQWFFFQSSCWIKLSQESGGDKRNSFKNPTSLYPFAVVIHAIFCNSWTGSRSYVRTLNKISRYAPICHQSDLIIRSEGFDVSVFRQPLAVWLSLCTI